MSAANFPAVIPGKADTLTLEGATNEAALYRLTISGKHCGWIVMRYRERKSTVTLPSGSILSAGSFRQPSPSDFGQHGWQYLNTKRGLEKALSKVAEISVTPMADVLPFLREPSLSKAS